jgi:hypothetical protein
METSENGAAEAQDDSSSTAASPSPAVDPRDYLFNNPTLYRVKRDGGRDIAFNGWLLGQGQHFSGKERGDEVEREIYADIYITAGGNYVGHLLRMWAFRERGKEDAIVCITGEELLQFFEGSDGSIGPASRDAWNTACANFPPLTPLAVEMID